MRPPMQWVTRTGVKTNERKRRSGNATRIYTKYIIKESEKLVSRRWDRAASLRSASVPGKTAIPAPSLLSLPSLTWMVLGRSLKLLQGGWVRHTEGAHSEYRIHTGYTYSGMLSSTYHIRIVRNPYALHNSAPVLMCTPYSPIRILHPFPAHEIRIRKDTFRIFPPLSVPMPVS